MKKIISIMMTIMMILSCAGGLSGCKEKETASENGVVTLKWVMPNAKQKDSDMVLEEFNKQLAEYLPDTRVEMEYVSAADYQEKWNLMMASNEEIDIGWSGYAVDFMSQVQQGSYMVLNDLLEQYGADMKNDLPEWLFDLGKVGEDIYCIPNYQMMATWPQGVRVLKEYTDKYLDKEALEAAKEKSRTDIEGTKEIYKIWEKCFEGIKNEGKIGNGIDISTFGGFGGSDRSDTTTVAGFNVNLDTMKVQISAESESTKLWYDTAADWYKKGYIRSDILSVDGLGSEQYKKGYIAWQHNWCDKTAELESKELGVELDVVKMGRAARIRNSIPVTSTVIARTSKNPERAMQLINLLNSEKGKDLYNLLVWGIEGVHYTKTSEKRIQVPYNTSQATSDEDYGLPNWSVASIKYSYEPQATLEGWAEYVYEIDENAEVSPILGFRPNTSAVATEIAQVRAVTNEYSKTLKYGAAQDHEKLYEEYITKLKAAGAEKIRDELQRQLDEWLEANK